MLNAEKPVFLRVTDETEHRVLHAGKVVDIEDDLYTCEFDREEDLSCEEGEAVFVYFEDDRRFMQQNSRVCSIADAESKLEITLKTTSDPISAESRACYRVSSVMLGLTVRVADEEDCPLLDVSASGMSASTTLPRRIGDELPVTVSHDGREYAGMVIVQSVRELREGRIRLGFHCVEDRRCGGNLQQGLGMISASIQRLLIKRMARL